MGSKPRNSRSSNFSRKNETRKSHLPIVVEQEVPSALPTWVAMWLFLSAAICTIDVAYTMNRPFTNDPNKLLTRTLFAGWRLYSSIDQRYADTYDLLTTTTGRMMLIEIILNFVAIGLSLRRSRHAILTAFTTSLLVLWKTLLFFSMYVGPPEGVSSRINPNRTNLEIFFGFWLLNGIWVVVPLAVISVLWNKLAVPVTVQERYWENFERLSGQLKFVARE